MDVSNKFLAFLLVIAIVVTLVGTWYSIDKVSKFSAITGFGTEGYVNITLSNFTNINVTATDCDFGSGYVQAGQTSAELSSNGTNNSWQGPQTADSMNIQNDGNRDVQLNVSSGKNAATFFGGGTSPSVKVWSYEGYLIGSGGCDDAGLVSYPGTEMDTTEITICANLTAGTGSIEDDMVHAGCYLIVPNDSPTGAKTDTWTFTGTAL